MLAFYFDFISPYAYLAWQDAEHGPRALAAKHGVELAIRPILLAGLLDHWGQLGPAEVPPKRAFLIKDVMRRAALAGAPFVYPDVHPFNPVTLLRLALVEVSGAQQIAVIDALFALVWGTGRDTTDQAALAGALEALGLDGAALLARTRAQDVKDALFRDTRAAVERGVFGVPTFVAGDELFWGSDRAVDVDRYLAGADPVDPAVAAAAIARPPGLTRPASRRPR